MSRFNTGNSIDSADPRDLSDNAKNLDQAINSESTTFTDRLGNERVTLAGGVDPTGFAQSALNDANRAEAAANAAFVNADVYDSIADGLDSGDEQFQVVEGVEIVRYRRIDSENAEEVARFPASEFVNISFDLASQPGLVAGEFHTAPPANRIVYAVTDEEGNVLFAVDENGEFIANIAGVGFAAEFHNGPGGTPDYCLVDEEGVIFQAWLQDGTFVIGGGDGAPDDLVDRVSDAEQSISGLGQSVDELQQSVSQIELSGLTGLPVFSSVSEALSSTSDGDFFLVEGEDGAFLSLYVNDGGSESLKNSLPVLNDLPTSREGRPEKHLWNDRATVKTSNSLSHLYFDLVRDEIFDTTSEIYARYDALMDEFPQYITREEIGESHNGVPIYAYTASPPNILRGSTPAQWPRSMTDPVEIVLVTGLHGHEKLAMWAAYTMLYEMCYQHDEIEVASKIRWNSRIIFIPALNPSGVDANTRKSTTGVDINRNSDYNWDEAGSTDPESNNYKGPEPFSEPETVVMAGLADRYPSAWIIDHHTHATMESATFNCWIGTVREDVASACVEALRDITRFGYSELQFVRDWAPTVGANGGFNRIIGQTFGTSHGYLATEKDARAFLLESPVGFDVVDTNSTPLDLRRNNMKILTSTISSIIDKAEVEKLMLQGGVQ